MFYQRDESGYVDVLEGIRRKTLVVGENTLLTEFRLDQDAIVPDHQHPQEQTGYLVSGILDFVIGGEQQQAKAGDSWSIPGNVIHRAKALEDSVVVEVFSPVREDYLP